MGAKNWMLCYVEQDPRQVLRSRPVLDRERTAAIVSRLYPGRTVTPARDGTLGDDGSPKDREVFAAAYPGLTLVCTTLAAGDQPSELAPHALIADAASTVFLHAMYSVVDWFAYAVWQDGGLVRSLSLSPDSGVMEDIGPALPFEEPYWSGQFPAVDPDEDDDPYPLPFHPLDLGEAALQALLRITFEGDPEPGAPDPYDIALAGFTVSR